jgi:hypothetical protein
MTSVIGILSYADSRANYERRQGGTRLFLEAWVSVEGAVLTARHAWSTFSANSLRDPTHTP